VSAASGLLLEAVDPPRVRRFEKDLRHIIGVRVPCGSDPSDRSLQVIVATPKIDASCKRYASSRQLCSDN
jgi:hypothetical protein